MDKIWADDQQATFGPDVVWGSALSRLALKCCRHRTRPLEQWLMTKDFFVHLNSLAVMRSPWWERK